MKDERDFPIGMLVECSHYVSKPGGTKNMYSDIARMSGLRVGVRRKGWRRSKQGSSRSCSDLDAKLRYLKISSSVLYCL